MNSALFTGTVRHRRRRPVENAFSYSIFMTYLDLAELDEVFRGRLFWSTRRPAPFWFRRADHLGDPGRPLDESVRDLVQARIGRRPAGPIRLLTHLRTFGHVMNPVSVYYCFDADDRRVETLVAEVHNTPWGERHCYVLDRPSKPDDSDRLRFRFDKEFHVSPFMGMDQSYSLAATEPGRRLVVHMENLEAGEKLFDATLDLARTPITSSALVRVALGFPLMTLKVVAAIYWQALRLWLKRCPFHPHPAKSALAGAK